MVDPQKSELDALYDALTNTAQDLGARVEALTRHLAELRRQLGQSS